MADVEIIGLPQSNFVWATRIAAAEKGVPHSVRNAAPHTPEVLAIHPAGKIPVMRHGTVTLCESRAICGYLDAAFEGPPLLPRDARARAEAEQWVSMIATTIEPVVIRQYLFAYLFPGTADGRPDPTRIAETVPKVEAQLDLLERLREAGGFGGSAFGLADAYLVPILFYLGELPEGAAALRSRPGLDAYRTASLGRPSVLATMPPPLPKA